MRCASEVSVLSRSPSPVFSGVLYSVPSSVLSGVLSSVLSGVLSNLNQALPDLS